ncbi:MAG: RimK/LysX family protein [Acidimicrobiales bacterium]
MARRPPRQRPVVGWREWLVLPELCETPLKAKVDTGARTSALHAFRLEVVPGEAGPVASFEMHPVQRSARGAVRVEWPVQGFRRVRSSNGKVESRPVIRTTASVGGITWPIDVTLTSRDAMGFRMLLGRSALKSRFVVDPGRSFLQPAPERIPGE